MLIEIVSVTDGQGSGRTAVCFQAEPLVPLELIQKSRMMFDTHKKNAPFFRERKKKNPRGTALCGCSRVFFGTDSGRAGLRHELRPPTRRKTRPMHATGRSKAPKDVTTNFPQTRDSLPADATAVMKPTVLPLRGHEISAARRCRHACKAKEGNGRSAAGHRAVCPGEYAQKRRGYALSA